MDYLASLESEQLLRLLIAIVACAVVLAVMIFAYLFFAWRRNRKSASVLTAGDSVGTGTFDTGASGLEDRLATLAGDRAASAASGASDDAARDVSGVDVDARLSGIGKDAWQYGLAESAKESPPLPGEEVLRLGCADDGVCWVEIAGIRYRTWADIRDRAVSDNVLRAVSWCLRFSNGLLMSGKGVRAAKVPACDTVPVPVALSGVSGPSVRGEVFRLLSDSINEEFWVQVHDECYPNLVKVREKEIGERILFGIGQLLQFSQGRLMTDSGLMQATLPAPPDQAIIPQGVDSRTPEPSLGPDQEATERRMAQEQFIRDMLEEKERLAQGAVESPGPSLRSESPSAQPPTGETTGFDLVADIDRIFQAKLAASTMADVDAEILAGPDGGVRIRVGTKHYSSPDEVPNSELRRMIKAAIAEW